MATWQEIGRDNFRVAVSLYESGHYRSATSRFYYAAFSVVTHELLQRNASGDFTGGRGTPSHAQLARLVELYFTQFSEGRLANFIRYVNALYADRIAADYSLQRVDRQATRDTYAAAKKVLEYLEVR